MKPEDTRNYLACYKQKALDIPENVLSKFLVDYANMMDVRKACECAGISILQLRKRIELDEVFRQEYDSIRHVICMRLESELIDRAMNGVQNERWVDEEGHVITIKHDTKYLELALMANMPEKYRAHGNGITNNKSVLSLNIVGDLLKGAQTQAAEHVVENEIKVPRPENFEVRRPYGDDSEGFMPRRLSEPEPQEEEEQ